MEKVVYIAGQFVPASEAKVSVFDRGFLFGDGVYEVIPVYQGRLCFFEQHIKRLKSSLASARIHEPQCNWRDIFNQLIAQNGSGNMQIYLQVTRGWQENRSHDFPDNLIPTVVAFTLNMPYYTTIEKMRGLSAWLVEDIRWKRCDIKATSMLANVLLNDDAVSNGADTALLIRDGYLTEGSSSNVFIVNMNGEVQTPPINGLCLPGVTRQLTIELVKSLNWPFKETKIDEHALLSAKEVWITSTTKEIYPVATINGKSTGDIRKWNYWKIIHEHYQQRIKNQQ
ncbi:aminotransferase class IV [Legionella impletisoli]|uniref:Aminodeoxychorismate lyase n=1 Tax=Legionella impletisoli TaxID=343510 RepID=A0A917JLL3_9GAMM|nr:aminotransferase class IV [Legionella impletisoli]GGI76003.1 cytochrome c551 [Legionella impletisoli]